jgi:hypothetical protein
MSEDLVSSWPLPCTEVVRETMRLADEWLEHFFNMRAVFSCVQGGFFLRKKPLGILLSLYSNWKNALVFVILNLHEFRDATARTAAGSVRAARGGRSKVCKYSLQSLFRHLWHNQHFH